LKYIFDTNYCQEQLLYFWYVWNEPFCVRYS